MGASLARPISIQIVFVASRGSRATPEVGGDWAWLGRSQTERARAESRQAGSIFQPKIDCPRSVSLLKPKRGRPVRPSEKVNRLNHKLHAQDQAGSKLELD